MASDFVRNIKDVRNINILSPNITTENDLISTTDGDVYVVTKKGYRKITNIETKDFEDLKKQADTNTLNISELTDDLETNTSEIETLKTTSDNNTSDIDTLKTKTDNYSSDIKSLKSTTETNTSDIESIRTTTETNTSDIESLKTSTSNNEKNIDSKQTLIEQLQKQFDELKSKALSYYTLFEGSVNGVGKTIKLNDDYTKYKLLFISGRYNGGDFTQEYSTSLSDSIVVQKTNVVDGSEGGGHYELVIKKINNTELKIINDVFYDFTANKGSGADANKFTITNIEGVK